MKSLFLTFCLCLLTSVASADRVLQVTPMGAVQGFALSGYQYASGCKSQKIHTNAATTIDMSQCTAYDIYPLTAACVYQISPTATVDGTYMAFTVGQNTHVTNVTNTASPFLTFTNCSTAQIGVNRGSR